MSRFNSNKIRGFDQIGDLQNADLSGGHRLGSGLLNEASQERAEQSDESIWVRFDKLVPNPKNEMSFSDKKVKQLAQSIEQVGVLDPLNVYQMEDGRYMILSGETRYHAVDFLRKQGKYRQDDLVEIRVKDLNTIKLNIDKDLKEMLVLLSGNINRDKTEQDRAFEIKGWKQIIEACRKQGIEVLYMADSEDDETSEQRNGIQIAGRKTREIIAEQTQMSPALIGQYEQVEKNGSEALKEALLGNKVPVHLASRISKLSHDQQTELVTKSLQDKPEDGKITKEDVQRYQNRQEQKTGDMVKITKSRIMKELKPLFSKLQSSETDIELSLSQFEKLKKKISELEKLIW